MIRNKIKLTQKIEKNTLLQFRSNSYFKQNERNILINKIKLYSLVSLFSKTVCCKIKLSFLTIVFFFLQIIKNKSQFVVKLNKVFSQLLFLNKLKKKSFVSYMTPRVHDTKYLFTVCYYFKI